MLESRASRTRDRGAEVPDEEAMSAGVNVWSAVLLQAKSESAQGGLRKCIRSSLESCSLRTMMECAAFCSYLNLNRQPQAAVLLHRFPERRDRPLCHLIARQQTWLVGISTYVPVYSFSRLIEDGFGW